MTVKPTLILLPGFDGTGRLFTPLNKQLSKEINTIVLSYPNDKPMTYSELCYSLKDELPDAPFILLGESFGGPLAMLLSQHADENIKGIILCATFVRNPHVLLTKLIRPFLKPKYLRKETPALYIKTMLTNGVTDQKLIQNIQAATRGLSPEIYFTRLREIADVDVSEILRDSRLPITYFRASRDRLVNESSMKIVKNENKDVTAELFDAPHMLLQTQPKQAAESIEKFIEMAISS